ncbi:MAG: DNA-binding NarL/FixJ family response regulator [Halioglobus sp.]|jgi:DNA-binding NarL/FixJ family response regulator
MSTRVLIVDDQQLVRDGLQSLLQLKDSIAVIGQAANGKEALAFLAAHEVDVVLLDIRMPEMDGLQLLAQRPDTLRCKFIVLTTFDEPQVMLDAIRLGARGFLLKDVSLEFLITAVDTVMAGETLIQPTLSENLIARMAQQPALEKTALPEPLSKKEIDVLRLLAGGFSNREIAQSLHKSEGTIKNQVSAILAKLQARDRTQAVLKAILSGLLMPSQDGK